ncbi:unnamed protein product [Thelazia callipaeda]|uniref:Uncharacterized protein n=1 Tax=Thelazia callipaeda TaxID=103827 RepID=A0A0N5D0B9_THECL|nr:unnamed protein product [Thelazia callipaeda]
MSGLTPVISDNQVAQIQSAPVLDNWAAVAKLGNIESRYNVQLERESDIREILSYWTMKLNSLWELHKKSFTLHNPQTNQQNTMQDRTNIAIQCKLVHRFVFEIKEILHSSPNRMVVIPKLRRKFYYWRQKSSNFTKILQKIQEQKYLLLNSKKEMNVIMGTVIPHQNSTCSNPTGSEIQAKTADCSRFENENSSRKIEEKNGQKSDEFEQMITALENALMSEIREYPAHWLNPFEYNRNNSLIESQHRPPNVNREVRIDIEFTD